MEIDSNTTKKRVAIIGAGPCGLIAARHLVDIADVQIYESKNDVGGQWHYDDYNEDTHPDLQNDAFYQLYGCLHSSMYKGLVPNSSKHLMTYNDFPISKDYPFKITQTQYHTYLKEFAENFDLYNKTKFKTLVKSVKVEDKSDIKYKVTTIPADVNEGTDETVDYFDYVVVCNGHHTVPLEPEYEGKSDFEGKMLHVHKLRCIDEEDFGDKRILVIGVSIGGCDIADYLLHNEAMKVRPKKITLAARAHVVKFIEKSFSKSRDENKLEYTPRSILKITKSGVIFDDGEEENFDVIIFSTGYKYSFPFFDPKDNIIEFDPNIDNGEFFGPLYKKIFAINYPQIMFVGLIARTPLLNITFERQAQLIKQYVAGDLRLPSREEMLESMQKEIEAKDRTPVKSKFFQLGNPEGYSCTTYHKEMCELSNLPTNEEFFKTLCKSNEIVAALFANGKGCEVRTIDWYEPFGDLDYHTSSKSF